MYIPNTLNFMLKCYIFPQASNFSCQLGKYCRISINKLQIASHDQYLLFHGTFSPEFYEICESIFSCPSHFYFYYRVVFYTLNCTGKTFQLFTTMPFYLAVNSKIFTFISLLIRD